MLLVSALNISGGLRRGEKEEIHITFKI